jgi:hypothetical protein
MVAGAMGHDGFLPLVSSSVSVAQGQLTQGSLAREGRLDAVLLLDLHLLLPRGVQRRLLREWGLPTKQ